MITDEIIPVTVDVLQGDISRGQPGLRCACPVWHAVSRALPGLDIAVTSTDIRLLVGGQVSEDPLAALPAAARAFISAFDKTGTGRPFTFTLNIPAGILAASRAAAAMPAAASAGERR